MAMASSRSLTSISMYPPSCSRVSANGPSVTRRMPRAERADAAIDATYRADWGRIVATLIRLVGDFDVAEEAAQEAFAAAAEQWRTAGIPEFPRAWIIRTARHKAIDRIRRRARLENKLDAYVVAGFGQALAE